MLAGRPAAKHRTLRLDSIGKNFRQTLFQKTRNAGKSPCGSRADDQRIDAAFHLLENFRSCSFVMKLGVGRIFKLTDHERVGIARDKLVGPLNGSLHALNVGSANDFGAEGPHDHDFFFGKTFGNE